MSQVFPPREVYLLKELIEKQPRFEAPWKTIRAKGHYQFHVALGKDAVAEIIIHQDGLDYLNEL